MIFLKCKIRFIYVGVNCKRKKRDKKMSRNYYYWGGPTPYGENHLKFPFWLFDYLPIKLIDWSEKRSKKYLQFSSLSCADEAVFKVAWLGIQLLFLDCVFWSDKFIHCVSSVSKAEIVFLLLDWSLIPSANIVTACLKFRSVSRTK